MKLDEIGILSHGYRPFFWIAALWSAVAMVLWVMMFSGVFELPSVFNIVDWHVHEMLFGFLPAVVAGFLLTAVPNWTGRLPLRGLPLLWLIGLWVLGRIAVWISLDIGPWAAGVVDSLFGATLILVIGREIVTGRNWRNLPVLILVSVLFLANVLFHYEAVTTGYATGGYSTRMAIAIAILLISLIGGRIIPSFTRNWLAKRGAGMMPVAFNAFDRGILLATAVMLGLWVAAPGEKALAYPMIALGVLHLIRMVRWAAWRTLSEPLLTILHVGYLFIPLGFAAIGFDMIASDIAPHASALHSWTAGAIGIMTLAVMTRASLGHSGKELTAGPATVAIYLCILAAVILRIAAGYPGTSDGILHAAAGFWILAYGGFAAFYGPMLFKKRNGPA